MSTDAPVVTTEIVVAGANCPWCLEHTVDALRAEPGVVDAHTSATGQCLSIDHHGLEVGRLVDIVRVQLHGYDLASSETVMVEVDPHVAALHCTHGRTESEVSPDAHGPDCTHGRAEPERPPDDTVVPARMETMVEAAARLQGEGYVVDFTPTTEGRLRCRACGADHDPASMVIDHVVRYEGASDPDDEAILLALRCGCGERGLYVAAFGPSASTVDVAVLRRLP